ncbi:hypothetical protein UK23_29585 [Lentzea aerocolonigenes]|uniref:Uncharacterized protein n=1 Tax=Lentzea aerocolonigenes TaxID=68170 RepID=A0A0F0GQX7_LENAE|nr:hypothetical protein [Lentzea aerocolonigenes]KJK44377.1 hypothetical protein UK23_29585 [Lentzea aerocolonigenes]
MDTPVSDLRILVDGVDLAGDVIEYQVETPRIVHNLGDYFDGANVLGPVGFVCCVRGVWNDERTLLLAQARERDDECFVTVAKGDLALEVPCDVSAFRSIRLDDGRQGWEAAFVMAKSLCSTAVVTWKELVA